MNLSTIEVTGDVIVKKRKVEGNVKSRSISLDGNVLASNGTLTEWGKITGDLDDQTDLKDALDGKADADEIPTKLSDLENDEGFITGINSSDVTTALGYTPYNSSNPSGYISGITSAMVTDALGFTPYSDANPSGFTSDSALTTEDIDEAIA